MQTAKEEVVSLLRRLPDDSTLEDIQYHLYVLEKIRRGIAAADAGHSISQEEAEKRLDKWITQ